MIIDALCRFRKGVTVLVLKQSQMPRRLSSSHLEVVVRAPSPARQQTGQVVATTHRQTTSPRWNDAVGELQRLVLSRLEDGTCRTESQEIGSRKSRQAAAAPKSPPSHRRVSPADGAVNVAACAIGIGTAHSAF